MASPEEMMPVLESIKKGTPLNTPHEVIITLVANI